MPVITLSDRQASDAVPAVRHALRAANAPAWVKAAFAALGKWLPTIIAIIVQLAPLFASPAGPHAMAPGMPDVAEDPALRPECREAILAMRAGRLGD